MTRSRLEYFPGVTLDARRSVYLSEERLLAVADLHLGYAWAHRHRGQLMPLSVPDDTAERLESLLDDYRPRTLAILGDIVHAAVPIEEFRCDLRALLAALESRVELQLVAGNHDRHLAREISQPLIRELAAGPHRLIHGDIPGEAIATILHAETRLAGGLIMMGHEHPAITLSDGIAHRVRVPCFLAGQNLLVLPAFSAWAAGSDIRRNQFMSPFPALASPTTPIAILAGKLLPVPQRPPARPASDRR